MTDALDAGTFDLADMFAGISYPKTVVPVYTNPGVGYEINKLTAEAKDAVLLKDEEKAKEIQERRDQLVAESEKFRYEFTLQGHSKDEREALLDSVRAKFPPEKNWMGAESWSPEADKMHIQLTWALHIASIKAPNGAINTAPGAEGVELLRAKLPDGEQRRIEAAIQELTEGAKAGFETLAQEHDFLSVASVEA